MKNKMKNLKLFAVIILGIILIGGFTFAKKNKEEGTPSIKFTETLWDFGTVKKDRPAVHEFEFVNDGTGNLIIKEATAQCGCTRPEYSDKPVAPGKKGKIKVSFNAAQIGSFEKTITVRSNGNPKKVYLKIRGVVAPAK